MVSEVIAIDVISCAPISKCENLGRRKKTAFKLNIQAARALEAKGRASQASAYDDGATATVDFGGQPRGPWSRGDVRVERQSHKPFAERQKPPSAGTCSIALINSLVLEELEDFTKGGRSCSYLFGRVFFFDRIALVVEFLRHRPAPVVVVVLVDMGCSFHGFGSYLHPQLGKIKPISLTRKEHPSSPQYPCFDYHARDRGVFYVFARCTT